MSLTLLSMSDILRDEYFIIVDRRNRQFRGNRQRVSDNIELQNMKVVKLLLYNLQYLENNCQIQLNQNRQYENLQKDHYFHQFQCFDTTQSNCFQLNHYQRLHI